MRHVSILNFRYFVFTLALGYWFYQFMVTNYTMVGLQFRLLTFWGLTGTVCVAWLMLSLSRKGLPPAHDALVSAVAVLNGIVVFLYWKMYFIDPALVNGSGPIVWYQEYYLHAVGPGLMIADALFINGAFKQRRKGLLLTVSICLAYIFWTEIITRPLNDTLQAALQAAYPIRSSMI